MYDIVQETGSIEGPGLGLSTDTIIEGWLGRKYTIIEGTGI